MDTYDAIKIDQDGIELANPFQTIYHPQDDDIQGIMAVVETNKQVYMFYQAPYQ